RGAAAGSHAGENRVWDVASNLWHPENNLDGYLSLGVVENALMYEELSQFVQHRVKVPHKALTYDDGPIGSKHPRESISRFLTRKFQPAFSIEPEHIVVTNGLSTAIEHCSWALADPGDGVLLGQPYYRAFLADIGLRFGVKVVPVPFGKIDPCGIECVNQYEETIKNSKSEGMKIRALVLYHPYNPLGRYYSRDTIIALTRLCQKHGIHLISDEVYALSIWKNTIDTLAEYLSGSSVVKFESVSSINPTGIVDPSLVHVLWGIGKDFGANGLRLGVVISQSNRVFLTACGTCALYSSASSLSEYATAEILNDEMFVDQYIEENRKRLSEAHGFAVQLLQNHCIEHAPVANAAFFLWINLGKAYLSRHPEEATFAITDFVYQKLMSKRIYLVSGDVTGAEEPGWFRPVFSQPREQVEEGIRRIIEAIR
ncbi:aminotransferase, partial [Glonium stellatum]